MTIDEQKEVDDIVHRMGVRDAVVAVANAIETLGEAEGTLSVVRPIAAKLREAVR